MGSKLIKTCLEYESKPIIYFWFLRIFSLISKDQNKIETALWLMYGETFYGRHTTQHQLQWMQIKIRNEICDSCIVSSLALLIFLLCLWWPKWNFFCCVITLNGESSRDLLLSVTTRKALAPGGHSPPEPPFKTLITIIPSHFLTARPAVGVLVGEKS